MKLQRRLDGEQWVDIDPRDIAMFIAKVIKHDSWIAPLFHRKPLTSHQDILDLLATGKKYQFSSDWYYEIRDADFQPGSACPD
ncbi:MAG TPA: hypothetical protein VLH56_08840 [Dissulfurispiraceae bacterium]|nr:hypothetical protein [Dissulfurispiraceae bacterium]